METSNSSDLRQRVVAAALSWIGTPFHHRQCVKGRGVDCAMSLIAWFSEAGALERFEPPEYSASWFLHRDEERFLEGIARYAIRLQGDDEPLPADIAIYKYGRCAAHGALIIDDDFVVHACAIARKVERRERSALAHSLHSYWRVIRV